jgi:hypothetical protein
MFELAFVNGIHRRMVASPKKEDDGKEEKKPEKENVYIVLLGAIVMLCIIYVATKEASKADISVRASNMLFAFMSPICYLVTNKWISPLH